MSSEKVSFIQRHEPALKDGEYTIEVTQDVSLLGEESGGLPTNLTETVSKTIYVAGERFSIGSKNIFKQFPPPNNTGDYSNVLPHIVLTRSTLPWERSTGDGGSTPWMYLFVYDDDDIEQGYVKKLKASSATINQVFEIGSSSNSSPTIPLTTEPGDESTEGILATTALDVIKIDIDWLTTHNIFPTADELKLLTSVRKNDIKGVDTEHAICMANRMPKRGVKTYASLISLEGRLGTVDDSPAYQEQGVTDGFTSFVTLAQWSFSCLDNNCYQLDSNTLKTLREGIALPSAWQIPSKAKALLIQTYTDSAALLTALNTAFGTLPANFSSYTTHIENCFTDGTKFKVTETGLIKLASLRFPLSKSLTTAIEVITLPELFTNQSAFKAALTTALGSSVTPEYTSNVDSIVACLEVPDRTFQGLLQNLSSASFRCDSLENSFSGEKSGQISIANEYLSSGAIPFPHHLQDGGKTISWYHGPLKPNNQQSTEALPSPIQSSDQLLRFDNELNMLDVSYAAAWELGRLMTLNNKSIAMDLYTWKRQQTWKANRTASKALKILETEEEHKSELKEEAAILAWTTKLVQLKNIPFNYLVSDEKMLPKESIRFFSLDKVWMDCLLEGALSIGRSSDDLKIFQPITTNYSGFILRSEVVSGWPHLEVSAKDSTETPLTFVTKTALGPDMMLCLFEGEKEIHQLDVHLKPESLHFGFDVAYTGDTPSYYKPVRFQFSSAGDVTQLPTPYLSVPTVTVKPAASNTSQKVYINSFKVVDIATLNNSLQTTSGSAKPFTSAQFAMEMIEGVPHVIFTNNGSEKGTVHRLSDGYNVNSSIINFNGGPGLGGVNNFADTDPGKDPGKDPSKGAANEDANMFGSYLGAPPAPVSPSANADENPDGDISSVELPKPVKINPVDNTDTTHLDKLNNTNEMEDIISEIKEVTESVGSKVKSLKGEKAFVWLVIGIIVLASLTWLITSIVNRHQTQPLVAHFEGIKEMEEIEFVQQEYHEIIPVTSKQGKLEFLLTAPASISGKMDMTQLEYQVHGDSVMDIILPHVIISAVTIDLNQVDDYDDRGTSVHLFLSGGGREYEKVYTSIINALNEAKKGVLASAIKDNIISETNMKARSYLISMAKSMGYRVNFVQNNANKGFENELKERLGGKLWRKIKHKVKTIPSSILPDKQGLDTKETSAEESKKDDNTKKRRKW
jgi:hypothetical protein